MEIGKTFCGRTDGWPEFQSTRSSVGNDLKTEMYKKSLTFDK